MTINAPASLLLLLYELVAEDQGVPGTALRGTVQNDILKEYVARGNYIFPPRPSMRLTTDLFAYCEERIPHWNTISISGYHIREAGSTAAQELAFTLANGIAYCEAAVAAGLSPDAFGARLSFFFNAHNDFFQEVAKFRAARTLWAQIMRDRFGATSSKAQALRFHAQTGGSTLTAQQPENNVVRVAIQALSAVCGGAQSLHTNSFDEALALPSEHAATIALRTQQILMHEAGTTDTADPLGGSYYVEALTAELEERARELIERVDELGGAVAAIEAGFVQGEIEESAFRFQSGVESGEPRRRRGERVHRRSRTRTSSSTGSIRRPSSASASARPVCAPSATPRTPRPRSPPSRETAAGTGNLLPRCARRCAPAARSARSAAPPGSSGEPTTPSEPRARRCETFAMRILLVSQMYPGPAAPALGSFVATLEQALADRGHEIERAVVDRPGGRGRHVRLAVDVVGAARRFDPDVVYAHFLVPAGLLAALGGRAPLVVTAHGQDVENARRSRAVRAATRATVSRAAAVVAVSDLAARPAVEAVPEAEAKSSVIDCGVDLERFCAARRGAARAEVGWAPEGTAFLCVGSLTERKNVLRLARAFEQPRRGRARLPRRRPAAGRARGPSRHPPRRNG